MKITITRTYTDDLGTRGKLTTDTGFQFDTLELPWRDNAKGKSCIIADTYSAKVWFSPRFGINVIRLEDKHGRSDCLIHAGNFAGDTDKGYFTQIHGCTLVGNGYGQIATPDNKMQFGIKNSKTSLKNLTALVREPLTVEYVWLSEIDPLKK